MESPFLILILIVVIIVLFVYLDYSSTSIKNISKQPISEIKIEYLPGATTIKITEQNEINSILKQLDLEKWNNLGR